MHPHIMAPPQPPGERADTQASLRDYPETATGPAPVTGGSARPTIGLPIQPDLRGPVMATPDVTVRPFPDPPTADRPRRTPGAGLYAVCLILGPLLLGGGLAVWPWGLAGSDGAPDAAAIASDGDRGVLAMNLAGLGCVLSIGAALALATVVARRMPRAAVWGAALSVLGLCSMLLYSVADVAYLATDDITPAAPFEAWGVAYAEKLYTLVLFLACPLAVLGQLLLAVGLWRSRAVPRWSAVGMALSAGILVAAISEVGVLAIPFLAAAVAGAVPVIRAVFATPAR